MYHGFNAKKERKRTQVEKLQDEIKHLHKLLGTMVHLHERLKNERTQTPKVPALSTLSEGLDNDGRAIENAPTNVPGDTNREPTPGKDQKGA
jgi:hypothetical protein